MEVLVKACGDFQTNCYIINREIIIDPGVGAFEFIKNNVKNPIAILNTHGHFDHIWDNQKVKEYFNIPLYIHKEDEFLLKFDPFGFNPPKSEATSILEEGLFILENYEINIKHFPGHTPGSITIEIDNYMFSGDFVFKDSIGRVDFPYSNSRLMRDSLNKFMRLDYNKIIFPGHGESTSIREVQNFLPSILNL